VLALCGYDVELARRDFELLRRFPEFDSLPAARAGEIYLVNASAYFARPGPRIVDSLELLAGILHPEEFPEFTGSSFVCHLRRTAPPKFRVSRTRHQMIVDHAGGLHQRVADGRADELESALNQVAAHGVGFGCAG